MTIKRDFSHINKTFCRSALLLAATLTVAACYEGAGHFAAAHSIASSAANAQSTETARSAYDFVNSIGANTHLNYFDRAYGNFPFVEHELASIGIRHLRDGVHLQNANYNSGLYGRWVKLGNLGIRFDAVVDPRSNLGPVTPALLQQAYDLSGHTIELFEGPNELDVSGVSDWPTVDRSYDQAVFNAVRAMRNGPSVQVIGPSMAFAAHGAAVGNLSSAIDFGNLHSYPAGKMPSIIFPDQLLLARSISGNHAVIMTESGYHNALNDHHDQPAVSESAAARYIPRLFLENFAHEIPRTYLYEFLDEAADPGLKDNQLHWGLIRFDGTEKPAFNALKNLIAELADNAEPSQLQPLTWSLAGGDAQTDHLLLEKSDGEFDLILWREIPSYDTRRQADIDNAPESATLILAQKAKSLTLSEPSLQAQPLHTYSNVTRIPLEIPDHPLVVRILMP